MGVEVIKDESNVEEILQVLKDLEDTEVVVGVIGEGEKYEDSDITVLGVATIHEFGYSGVGKDGVFRNIPERSFIRASADAYREQVLDEFDDMIEKVLELQVSPNTLFHAIGEYCVKVIQDYIKEMTTPALSKFTIERKGSSKLLIDKGQLIGSITYEVRRRRA